MSIQCQGHFTQNQIKSRGFQGRLCELAHRSMVKILSKSPTFHARVPVFWVPLWIWLQLPADAEPGRKWQRFSLLSSCHSHGTHCLSYHLPTVPCSGPGCHRHPRSQPVGSVSTFIYNIFTTISVALKVLCHANVKVLKFWVPLLNLSSSLSTSFSAFNIRKDLDTSGIQK